VLLRRAATSITSTSTTTTASGLDYFCGTKHFLEYVEFLYYLKKYKYKDYLTSDTSPTRWDIKEVFEANSRMSNRIWDKLDK